LEENGVRFLSRFDAVVLLSAPAEVLIERLDTRTTNPFGKDPAELARVLADVREVEPLLRRVATHELDTTRPLAEVVDEVERIGLGA
jgi:shikimate kinase